MPIYEYECQKCGTFEVTQRITEKPLGKCPSCRGRVKKLISNTSFQLKGTGWYITDYARKTKGKDAEGGSSKGEGAKSEGSKSEGAKSDGAKSEAAKDSGASSGDKTAAASSTPASSKGSGGGRKS